MTGALLNTATVLVGGSVCLAQRPLARVANEGNSARIAQGFISTSLLFCVGPMTILGSIQDGLSGNFQVIAMKATLEGVASIAFAASLGWGVLLSALTVLIVQGSTTLGAQALSGSLLARLILSPLHRIRCSNAQPTIHPLGGPGTTPPKPPNGFRRKPIIVINRYHRRPCHCGRTPRGAQAALWFSGRDEARQSS